jgi:transcriptional regulator with XRE-family HTH domain
MKTDPVSAQKAASQRIAEPPGSLPNGIMLGGKLRAEREKKHITVREMARRVRVSPSLISQIERGLVTPSVGTLWSMTAELGLVMDKLFRDSKQDVPAPRLQSTSVSRRAHDRVQRGDDRKRIRLADGVMWERLTAQPDEEVEFLHVTYAVGAESCPPDSLFRHGGKEYAYLLEGRLGVQIGFEQYELSSGDSISFDARTPHRLWVIGNEPAVAIWVVINRTDDKRE